MIKISKISKNSKLIIYGKDGCLYCEKAVKWATERGINFEYRKVKNQEHGWELGQKYNTSSVPIILVDDKYIGGYLDLVGYD